MTCTRMLTITEYLKVYTNQTMTIVVEAAGRSHGGVSGLMFAVYFMQISETLHTLRHR